MLLPAAANRDPRRWDAPEELRLGRPNYRQHLAFGSGVHSCAGARRYEYPKTYMLRGLERLHLEFTPIPRT